MHKYAYILLLLLTTVTAHAQLTVNEKKNGVTATAKSDAGSLLAEFANVLKPDALNKSFVKQKKSFAESAKTSIQIEQLGRSALQLFSNVKPGYFKDAAVTERLIAAAAKIQSKSELSNVLIKFESNLKPQALNSMWKLQRSTWLHSLGMLK